MARNLAHELRRFAGSDSGATAIEYGLIAGLIALAIVGGVTSFVSKVEALYTRISAAF